MSLMNIDDNLDVNNVERYSKNVELIKEYDETFNIREITNVFQLRVQKAQYHLDHLKESIEKRENSTINNLKEQNISEDIKSKNSFGKFNNYLVAKSVILNPGQLVSVCDVLQETCSLVSRLEDDRNTVQIEINKQKTKVDELLSKIQGLSFFRMKMLPSAVQKEHEACSNDITELQWHIKHRSTIERKITEKRNKAADINKELNEEINEIKEYIPLVKEKLKMEEDVLSKIEETKRELFKESDKSTERMETTLNKHNDSNKKAEAERQHKKRDLHKAEKILSKTKQALQHAVKEHKKMEDFKLRSEEKIRLNNQQILKLNSENAGKLTEQNIYEELVSRLETTMREVTFDNRRLLNNRDQDIKKLEDQEKEQDIIIREKKAARDNLDQEMTTLKRNNQQTEIEIDTIKDREEKCLLDTEKTRDRIQSTKSDILEAEKTYEKALEEFIIEAKNHALVRQRLSERMKEMQDIEEKLRKSLSDIENQIKQEIMTKTTVKSKMTTDTVDLESSKKDSIEKQKQMKKALKETQAQVNEIRLQVAEFDSQHQKSSEELALLTNQNNKILSEQDAMRSEKKRSIEELTPIYEGLKARIMVLVQKEEHFQWQIKTMNSQLLEMTASEKLITNAKKKLQETLLDTEREYNDYWLELEIIRKYQDKLTASISQIVSRCNRMKGTHIQYLKEREEAIVLAKKELEQSLLTNETMAKHYRSSQTDFYGMEDAYLDVIQEHLWGEESVKNIKEIQRLQKHMHNCMDAFYRMKLMYDDDQYTDLKGRCGRNIKEIENLKLNYSERIQNMKKFLVETFPRESRLVECED